MKPETPSEKLPFKGDKGGMSLALRIREARKAARLTLDQLAEAAGMSKTYLWELEQDESEQKRPSADILLKIAQATSVTIADLLALRAVQVDNTKIDLSPSLIEFRDWMEKIGEALSEQEIADLATMRFRGGQPRTRDDWHDLFRTLKRTTGG